jgi:ABC-type uncharacterized transport system ATPase subunit
VNAHFNYDRQPGNPLLEVCDLRVSFGGIVALDAVSMEVQRGEICGLIGPNGAGKTTFFNCLSGLYRPSFGTILFDGAPTLSSPEHRMAGMGIGRTFQNLALFRTMTVLENIMVGRYCRTKSGFVKTFFRLPSVLQEEAKAERSARDIASFLQLGKWLDEPAGSLPFGIQKRIEFGRALAGLEKAVGAVAPAYVKDPSDKTWDGDKGMQQWRAWMAKYNPTASTSDPVGVLGYVIAELTTEVLKRCGDDLTRENVLRQAANLKDVQLTLLLPGIRINTSPDDYRVIRKFQFQRFDGKKWELFGNLVGD